MSSSTVDLRTYAKEVPVELRRAIKGLDDEVRTGLVVALLRHGEMTFTDIAKRFELKQSTLTYHLGLLTEGGLIENYYKKRSEISEYSFYRATEFCETILRKLYESLTSPALRASISSRGLEERGYPQYLTRIEGRPVSVVPSGSSVFHDLMETQKRQDIPKLKSGPLEIVVAAQ